MIYYASNLNTHAFTQTWTLSEFVLKQQSFSSSSPLNNIMWKKIFLRLSFLQQSQSGCWPCLMCNIIGKVKRCILLVCAQLISGASIRGRELFVGEMTKAIFPCAWPTNISLWNWDKLAFLVYIYLFSLLSQLRASESDDEDTPNNRV